MDDRDYKKELEEAIERARNLDSPFYKQAAEIIFPQLKEKETQEEKVARIIKASLSSHFDGKLSEGTNDTDYAECLAWVDKQLYKKTDAEPTDEFESFVRNFVKKLTENWTLIPSDDDIHKWSVMILNHAKEALSYQNASTHKFNVRDWCIDKTDGTVFIITKAEDNFYTYQTTEGKEYTCSYFSLETDARLWTLADAKAGDVLSTGYHPFIYNGNDGGGSCPGAFCGINALGMFKIVSNVHNSHWTGKKVYPATKEQRDFLFEMMREASYEWDAEKLKLVEVKPTTIEEKDMIDDAFTRMMLKDAEKQNNQNSVEWTESDESMYTRCLGIFGKCKCNIAVDEVDEEINWFKSLKEKIMAYQQSIHNWSDRDRDMTRFIGNAITTDEASKYLEEKGVEIIDAHVWLDELKERTTVQNWGEYD